MELRYLSMHFLGGRREGRALDREPLQFFIGCNLHKGKICCLGIDRIARRREGDQWPWHRMDGIATSSPTSACTQEFRKRKTYALEMGCQR